MTTLAQVNKALKEKLGDLELVRGQGYYYFSGSVCRSWRVSGLYGGWLLKDTKVSEYVQEAQRRNDESA